MEYKIEDEIINDSRYELDGEVKASYTIELINKIMGSNCFNCNIESNQLTELFVNPSKFISDKSELLKFMDLIRLVEMMEDVK